MNFNRSRSSSNPTGIELEFNKKPIKKWISKKYHVYLYKASASDSQVSPINLKLLPAILERMRIRKKHMVMVVLLCVALQNNARVWMVQKETYCSSKRGGNPDITHAQDVSNFECLLMGVSCLTELTASNLIQLISRNTFFFRTRLFFCVCFLGEIYLENPKLHVKSAEGQKKTNACIACT